MLVQTEIERVKFVIRSYMRTRLHKVRVYLRSHSSLNSLVSLCGGCIGGEIDTNNDPPQIEKYAKHINMTESLQQRLSKAELEHSETYVPPSKYYLSSFISDIPDSHIQLRKTPRHTFRQLGITKLA